MHVYTDWFLTLLEDSELCKGAFGFKKDTDEPVKNGGKKLVEHYHMIVKLLLVDNLDGGWHMDDIIKLGDAVKNWIIWCSHALFSFILSITHHWFRLKKSYTKSCNELTETGQGLVEADLKAEIIEGSQLQSSWGESI